MKKSEVNVLVVDDDRAIGQTLSEAITRAGYKAIVAARADEALNVVRIKHVHAAVVDCMLPVMNGVSLVEELRKTRFDSGVVILMSGIFKDKSFEQDALRKTGAVCYLQKPFGPLDLLSALKPHLETLVDNQQWSLQTILSKKLTSTRDRVKVVEHLEEIKGMESAFVLSILMDAKVSGFLNLVSDAGSIFGVTLKNGLVVSVDSENVDETSIRFLIDTGFLSDQDWKEFEAKESKRAPLQKLVSMGYISPHAGEQAKHDQIISDLQKILRFEKLNINFVPEQEDDKTPMGLDLPTIFLEMNNALDALLNKEYLKQFFQSHWTAPIKVLSTLSPDHPISTLPMIKRVRPSMKQLEGNSIEKLSKQFQTLEVEILKAIYCLVIFRQILFVDASAMKNFEADAHRRAKMLESIKDKDPMQIFQYFGTSPEAKDSEIDPIFKEFVKANHPDRLPPEAPADLRKITETVFGIVSGAHNTLINPEKRKEYMNKKQSLVAEKEMQSEAYVVEGMENLRRGLYQKAVEKFQQSLDLHFRNDTYCLHVWALVKAKNKAIAKPELSQYQRKLEAMVGEEKANPNFHMTVGLVKAAFGDSTAITSFEKAVSLQPSFVEARREINAIAPTKTKTDGSDLLNGDITQLVSQIFKRKAK